MGKVNLDYGASEINSAVRKVFQINDKEIADSDLSNLSTEGKSTASELGMPSGNYTDITLKASGSTYTAPANGYYVFDGVFSGYNFINMACSDGQSHVLNMNNGQYWHLSKFCPVKKGAVLTVSYQSSFSSYTFRFIYAEGEI